MGTAHRLDTSSTNYNELLPQPYATNQLDSSCLHGTFHSSLSSPFPKFGVWLTGIESERLEAGNTLMDDMHERGTSANRDRTATATHAPARATALAADADPAL